MAKPMSKSDLIRNSRTSTRRSCPARTSRASSSRLPGRLQGAQEDRHVPGPWLREVRGHQEAGHQGAQGDQPVHEGADGLQGQAGPQGHQGPPGQGRQRRGAVVDAFGAPVHRGVPDAKKGSRDALPCFFARYISRHGRAWHERFKRGSPGDGGPGARRSAAEDCVVQSMPDASPTKWHLAHTTWFFETFVLAPHVPGYRPFDPRLRATCSTPTTTRSASGTPRAAARPAVAARRSTRCCAYRAHVDERDAATALDARRRLDAGAALIELGLHHEQQHQELILTDIKHALRLQPAAARVPRRRRPSAPRSRAAAPLRWIALRRAALRRDRPRAGDGVRLRQRAPAAPRSACGRFALAVAPGDQRRVPARSSTTAATARPELWLSDGWAAVQRRAAGPRRSTGSSATATLVELHARRHAAGRPGRAGLPRQLLRGRRLRALGRRAPADRGRVGGRRARRAAPSAATSLETRRASTRAPAPRGRRRRSRSCSATSGSGPRAPTRPTPASGRRPARSASTTASSCATRWCCAAARARRRARTSARPTATSSRRDALADVRHPPGAGSSEGAGFSSPRFSPRAPLSVATGVPKAI